MKTTISALAELELNDAAQYYELSQQGLAEKFFSAFSETLAKIKMNPKAGCSYNKMTRYQMLNRFPYSVFYTTKNNEIVIVAIVHQHRMPGYWLSRINDNDICEPEAVYSATILTNGVKQPGRTNITD